ncbi:MAG: RNA pseudouridine synthase [Spirochaetaceae bacterium]|jgi:RluA family pseudouridine synthase|nr:RNA pseudouridine synthase [Spirochaetaceae bacterium]GMO19719.1 MAG: hypothetical protein Pg6A_06480 [Termitinemataceae bacterium]
MKKALWSVIYEDNFIVAVNKTSGIAVSGDRWTPSKQRLDRLLASELGQKIFLVHRIDSGTSGLVIFAKDEETRKKLCAAFERREVKKRYIAVVKGIPDWRETLCELPLLSEANKNHDTIVERFRGKASSTHFETLTSAGSYTALAAFPKTGRQHQIRVHLAALGHPVVCDKRYGDGKPVYLSSFKRSWRGERACERPLLSRLGLHAESLLVPSMGIELNAALPKDMAALLRQLELAAR